MRTVAARMGALAGLTALALVEPGLARAAALGGVAVVVAHRRVARALERAPWGLATVAAVVAAGWSARNGDPTSSLGLLLVYLQAHAHLAEPSEQRRPLALSALMLVTAAGATRDPWFGPLALLWAASLPLALLRGRPRARDALGIGAGTLAVAAACWVLAPRARPDEVQIELTGFTRAVELGTLDALLDDPRVVFTATVSPPPDETIYWRGAVLDTFDGRQWTTTSRAVSTRVQPPRVMPPDAAAFDIEPGEPGVVLTAGWPLALEAGPVPLFADGHGAWSARSELGHYRLVAQGPFGLVDRAVTPPESDDALLSAARALPADLDPRIRDLAATVAGVGTPMEQARRVVAWLREHQVYARTPPRGEDAPLSVFLFDEPEGHCEYFASALAVLLRAQGIPTRLVNGFVGGERAPGTSRWTVRRMHAHTWVEVYDRGWWRVDPTPGTAAATALAGGVVPVQRRLEAAWEEEIVAFDRRDQVHALLSAARAAESVLPFTTSRGPPWRGVAALGLAALGAAVAVRWTLRRWEPRASAARPARGPVARAFRRARRIAVERGYDLPDAAPPVEAAQRLQAQAPGRAADALLELAWLHYATALGGEDARSAGAKARALAREVGRLPPR